MSYQVLARKWRPKSFTTLVGQDHVVRALTNALDQQRLHHAYLFTGTRGVGKTTIARILAKSLNCETGITANPCGLCNACTEIDKGRFIDLIEVDAASNTQVDAMRELLENAQYAPTSGRFKVYIIDEVHMLSKSAFNAMLKTLEEPPAHVKFILATTDPQKVPVTVLSRCLQFNLRQMAGVTITEHLQHILSQENIPYEIAAIHLISRAANGSMRDALSLTDQAIAYGNQRVNEAEVRGMLGTIDQSYLIDIIHGLLKQDGALVIEKAQQMEARSIAFEQALNDLALLFHQIAIVQSSPNSLAQDLPERSTLIDLADKINPETLQLYYQITVLGVRDMSLAPDEYAGFTMTLLRMLAFTPQSNLAEKKTVQSNQSADSAKLSTSEPGFKQGLAATLAHIQANSRYTESNQHSNGLSHKPDNHSESTQNQTESQITAKTEMQDTIKIDTEMVKQPFSFDGDWHKLVEQHLKLGLARALAQNCEMLSYDEHRFNLRIAESQKHLASPNYQEKLTAAINQHFGKKIQLHFEIGKDANTPAKQNAVARAETQSNAESAILEDEFVIALINDFDATIIPNSIKPLQ